tara:strand:- start:40 stop:291 length:252 start_codon:yes stop_codon:yes gene_type:complete
MKKLNIILIHCVLLSACSGSDETPLQKAHKEYNMRAQGYQSSHLPRVGSTRGDDYRNCIDQGYHLEKDPHDFCSWHAGIGKYQ